MMKITELEIRLATDEGAAIQKKLLAEVADIQAGLTGRSKMLLPRLEFTTVMALLDSARAAHEVLSRWPVEKET